MNLQGLLESHGSWPSQASACGRAALGRLTHPLVGVLSKEQRYNGSSPYRNYNLVTRVQQGCNKVVIQGCNNHETWL